MKGGFIIFDDFRGSDWDNLQEQMRQVLPESHWVQLDATHPVFHSFFEIDDLQFLTSYNGYPTYYGIFEQNDPRKRLMAIANRDNDLGEYWEFSDTGYAPGRSLERGVQVRRELFHLWSDTLAPAARGAERVSRNEDPWIGQQPQPKSSIWHSDDIALADQMKSGRTGF